MANRNRTVMSRMLFERLIEHAAQQDIPISNPDQGRFIKRLSARDADLMAQSECKTLHVTRQIKLSRIDFDGETYFCLFGLPEADRVPLGLAASPSTPGIFATAILESGTRPSSAVTGATIRDTIEDYYVGNGRGYEGHELPEIEPLFPPMLTFKVEEPQPFHDRKERVLGALLVQSYLDGPIPLAPDTIAEATRTFEQGSDFIPYRNLLQGILSISWENLFFQAYRCVEQMYAAPRVEALRALWASAAPTRELARLLEVHLAWRPKEDEAIQAVFRECDEDTISKICLAMDGEPGEDTHVARSAFAARHIYGMRNKIAHYRANDDEIKKSDDEWNIIVRGMLEIIDQIYDSRGTAFFGTP